MLAVAAVIGISIIIEKLVCISRFMFIALKIPALTAARRARLCDLALLKGRWQFRLMVTSVMSFSMSARSDSVGSVIMSCSSIRLDKAFLTANRLIARSRITSFGNVYTVRALRACAFPLLFRQMFTGRITSGIWS